MRHAGTWFALVPALLAVAGGAGCDIAVAGNGDVISDTRAVVGFTRIDAEGSEVVHVREGAGYAVTVTTDSNIQHLVETFVRGDTLIIDERESASPTQLIVDVQLPAFRGATLAGSGVLDATATTPNDLDFALSGSGALIASGPAASVTASLSGSGTVTLSGTADTLSASLSGSGQLDARNFPVSSAALNVSGSGRLQATAAATVSLRISGSGDIDWWGTATVQSVDVSGSGRIAHHD